MAQHPSFTIAHQESRELFVIKCTVFYSLIAFRSMCYGIFISCIFFTGKADSLNMLVINESF